MRVLSCWPFFTLMALLLCLFAKQSGNEDIVAKEAEPLSDNGVVPRSLLAVADGEEGQEKEFSVVRRAVGQVETRERRRADGSLEARWTVWVAQGQPDRNHGSYELYWPNGTKRREGRFLQGQLDGVWRHWDENGVLGAMNSYVNGEQTGIRYVQLTKGTSILDMVENFRKSGVSVRWDSNSLSPERLSFFQADAPRGQTFAFVGEEAVLSESGSFSEGKRHGKWRYWSLDGKLMQLQSYVEGKLSGPLQRWYSSGQVSELSHYRNDKLHGGYMSWHENGQLKMTGAYQDGKRIGQWSTWDEAGNLVAESDEE